MPKALFQMKNRGTKDYRVYTIYMTLCNCHIYSPSMFPCSYVKYTFPPHLKNSTHYHSTSLHQNISIICFWHNFLEIAVIEITFFLKRIFTSIFPRKCEFLKGKEPLSFVFRVFDNDWYMVQSPSMLNNMFSFLSSRFPLRQHFCKGKQLNYN